MCATAVNFVVEGVIDSDLVLPMVVDGVGEQLKPYPMPRAIVSTRMFPRGCDEEICMDGLMKQCVNGVRSWTILQKWSA